jgi:DNA-directed RNA polymerase specialized sigma24 family protein
MAPGAFLATTVKRRAINLAARRRAEPDSDRGEETAAPNNGTDAAPELARIQALLYSPPEPQHQAFVLRHWSGLSNREIRHDPGPANATTGAAERRARESRADNPLARRPVPVYALQSPKGPREGGRSC